MGIPSEESVLKPDEVIVEVPQRTPLVEETIRGEVSSNDRDIDNTPVQTSGTTIAPPVLSDTSAGIPSSLAAGRTPRERRKPLRFRDEQ